MLSVGLYTSFNVNCEVDRSKSVYFRIVSVVIQTDASMAERT